MLSGISAVLGGSLWLVHTMLLAVRPLGCVGQSCFEGGRHHRDSEDIAWVLLVSVLLLAVSVWAAPGRDGRPRRLLSASFVLLTVGSALLVVGLIVNRGSSDGSALWWLYDSDTLGRIVPVLGTLMAGIGMLRDGTPRWLPALFIVAAAASLGVNIQDERVLLGLPVGLAWAARGVHLLLTRRRPAALPPRVQGDDEPVADPGRARSGEAT